MLGRGGRLPSVSLLFSWRAVARCVVGRARLRPPGFSVPPCPRPMDSWQRAETRGALVGEGAAASPSLPRPVLAEYSFAPPSDPERGRRCRVRELRSRRAGAQFVVQRAYWVAMAPRVTASLFRLRRAVGVISENQERACALREGSCLSWGCAIHGLFGGFLFPAFRST